MISKFQKAVYQLLTSEPYFAHFLLESKVMYDVFNVKSAAASVIGGVPVIIWNTEFMNALTVDGVKEVLKHEIMHLLLTHTNRAKEENKDHLLYNIATDCAINQYLNSQHFPAGSVTLESLSRAVGQQLKPFETAQYYYDACYKAATKVAAGAGKTVDDHDLVIDGQDIPEIAQAAVQKAGKAALASAAGNAPSVIVKALDAFGEPQISWKQIFKNFVLKQVDRTTRITQSKINRRLPLPAPGRKHKRTMTLGVCLDSSGSVSDEQYSAFFAEVKSIAKQITKVYIVHADCEVQGVDELNKKTRKIDTTRKGVGGTAYQPAITKCLQLGCDAIVYFGDFDTSDIPTDPKKPFLWVGVGNQNPPADWGKVLRIK